MLLDRASASVFGREITGLDGIKNQNQRRLLQVLYERPGLNRQELADALGVTRTAAAYHVRRLVEQRLLTEERQGSHRLFFPAGTTPIQRRALALLRVESVQVVALAAYRTKRIRVRALAARSDMDPRTVRRAIHALCNHHLIRCEKDGRSQVIHLHPELRIVLARWSTNGQVEGPESD